MTGLRIEPLCERHFEPLYQLFDAVCRERRFLAFTQAESREDSYAFYRDILDAGDTHVVAVRDGQVLGWCDVLRSTLPVRLHVGTLGMAVAAAERGRGVGRALIGAAIADAFTRGIRRIELSVHAGNQAGLALYRRSGFVFEGTLRQGWYLDGVYADMHCMARLAEAGAP